MKKIFSVLATFALLALLSPGAQACSVCFGDPNSSLSKGAVAGVGVLLVVVLGVLGFVAAFFVHVARRSAALNAQDNNQISVATAERV